VFYDMMFVCSRWPPGIRRGLPPNLLMQPTNAGGADLLS
jgi:hypothetical protein